MRYVSVFLLGVCLLVSACSGDNYAPVRQGSIPVNQNEDAVKVAAAPKKPYAPKADFYKIPKQVQCVPHARDVSGIQIRGNAHTWWDQAEGKGYKRGKKPKKGAVFVLSNTSRLKYGHVSVVKNIVDSRKIEVEHANWGGTMSERCIVYRYMPVQDVSKNNDWSLVRFWNYPSKSYGSLYKGDGFIYPKK
jgi:surface antigen